MELLTLNVETRERTGKGGARQTRRDGRVPATLYGQGSGNVNLTVDYRELELLLHGEQGEHAMLELAVKDNPDLSCNAMIKDVQHHPVRGHYLHTDFFRIDLKAKINTVIPVNLVGRSKGVIEGGVVDQQCREVEISCLPTDVPKHIETDITDLDIGDSLHVSDLVIPEGVELLTAIERAVVAIHAPRVVEETTDEDLEVVEGEAAEAESTEESDES